MRRRDVFNCIFLVMIPELVFPVPEMGVGSTGMPDPSIGPSEGTSGQNAGVATKKKPKKRDRRKDALPPPPAPEGDDNPSSYKNLMDRYIQAKVRAEDAEALLATLRSEPADPDAETSPRVMRKVLGQSARADAGHAEKVLRSWLDRDPKGFIAAIEEKERVLAGDAEKDVEMARLRSRNAELEKLASSSGPDQGSEKVLGLLDSWIEIQTGET